MVEDERLMEEVRDGEVGKLEILFERYSSPLFKYFLNLTCDRAAAEDLVQEVFFRILKFRHTYRSETTFRAWMYQVGRNVYLDQATRRRSESALPEGAAELASGEMPADRQLEKRQEAALVRRALASLPAEKREVLILSRFLEWKYQDIAAALECEVGTVKGRVFRAMRELGDRFAALSCGGSGGLA
ncbi:MAG TPA: RNA polymerase sigma factor [Bryobacteraceae bacterium]|nr:RNA polymerase sigma factor [Bryobacteraceae bacterium]